MLLGYCLGQFDSCYVHLGSIMVFKCQQIQNISITSAEAYVTGENCKLATQERELPCSGL